MTTPRWKGTSNSIARRRIERIRWTRRDNLGLLIISLLVFLTVMLTGWLSYNYHD
jgi:hypothetical protein